MKKSIKMVLAMALSSALLIGCGQQDEDKSKEEKLQVSTTVFPLQSFAKQIGGAHVEVSSIYPKGSDLHSFEPSQKDIMNASKADVFIYTGDQLDPVAKKVASTIKEEDKKLSLENHIDKSELLTDTHAHEDEHGHDHHHHGGYDPHVWLDPKFDEAFVKSIRDEFVKKDPKHKKTYEKNAEQLLKEIEEIDQKLKDVTKGHKGNAVFISHESLGYLAHRYGFEQVGIQSLNAEDPSQKELQRIVKEINETQAKYILYEENLSNKVTDTVRKETKAEPLQFNNMESVSKEQSKDATYQSLMQQNIKHIEKALNDKITVEHDHDKENEKHSKAIYDGYFKDSQVKDRELSDYEGQWQSVYPLLKDGTLDEVFEQKAKQKGDKSAKAYKAYYDVGYKTDIEQIKISHNEITFVKNGKAHKGQYVYDGKDILKYEKGNRGVRYTFKLVSESDAGLPKYIQFSDHNIAPTKTGHFHIFIGDDRDKLLEEMDNWPTYYPSQLSKEEIKEEMLAH